MYTNSVDIFRTLIFHSSRTWITFKVWNFLIRRHRWKLITYTKKCFIASTSKHNISFNHVVSMVCNGCIISLIFLTPKNIKVKIQIKIFLRNTRVFNLLYRMLTFYYNFRNEEVFFSDFRAFSTKKFLVVDLLSTISAIRCVRCLKTWIFILLFAFWSGSENLQNGHMCSQNASARLQLWSWIYLKTCFSFIVAVSFSHK